MVINHHHTDLFWRKMLFTHNCYPSVSHLRPMPDLRMVLSHPRRIGKSNGSSFPCWGRSLSPFSHLVSVPVHAGPTVRSVQPVPLQCQAQNRYHRHLCRAQSCLLAVQCVSMPVGPEHDEQYSSIL